MKLADAFATALAPVFASFAGAIKALSPFLVTLGAIIADLAQAVLGDLAGAFQALAALLVQIAPSLNILAKALGAGVHPAGEHRGVRRARRRPGVAGHPARQPDQRPGEGPGPGPARSSSALLGKMAGAITAGLVVIIGGVANALTAIVKAIPPVRADRHGGTPLSRSSRRSRRAAVISAAAAAIGGSPRRMLGLDASMDANPIGLVVIAIAALGVAFYEA